MIDTYLVAEKTIVNTKGDGSAISLDGTSGRVFLVALNITSIVEQEALELSVFGSPDGEAWSPKPLLTFPQKFYRGESPLLLDLSETADVKFVRAHWEVNRWGRGPEQPMFEFSVRLKDVPKEMLSSRS